MIDILHKYKEKGSFNFIGNNLKEVCNAPKDKAGIYLMYDKESKIESLIYIGCSGHIKTDGSVSIRKTGGGGIYGRIVNGHQFGNIQRHISLPRQMKEDNISILEVHWLVTHNSTFSDSPTFVEHVLLQRYLDKYKRLPMWNKKF